MAKWIIIDPESGQALVHQPENETLEYDNGQHAAAAAAAFLIDVPDVELPERSEEELAAIHAALDDLRRPEDEQSMEDDDEPEVGPTELHVICLEHGVRIRMIRETIEPLV
jgi:hypothetical protein